MSSVDLTNEDTEKAKAIAARLTNAAGQKFDAATSYGVSLFLMSYCASFAQAGDGVQRAIDAVAATAGEHYSNLMARRQISADAFALPEKQNDITWAAAYPIAEEIKKAAGVADQAELLIALAMVTSSMIHNIGSKGAGVKAERDTFVASLDEGLAIIAEEKNKPLN